MKRRLMKRIQARKGAKIQRYKSSLMTFHNLLNLALAGGSGAYLAYNEYELMRRCDAMPSLRALIYE